MSDQASRVESNEIEQWLVQSGYPFGMDVAGTFSKAGFEISQITTDENPNTAGNFELVAELEFRSSGDSKTVGGSIVLVVTCVSNSKPLIVLTRENSIANNVLDRVSSIAQRPGTVLGKQLLGEICNNKAMHSLHLFSMPPRIGYKLLAYGKLDKADYARHLSKSVLSALTQAIASRQNDHSRADLFFPVILVDAEMYEYYLDNDQSSPLLKRIDSTLLHADKQFIMTISRGELQKLIAKIEDSCRVLSTEALPILSKMESKLWKRRS